MAGIKPEKKWPVLDKVLPFPNQFQIKMIRLLNVYQFYFCLVVQIWKKKMEVNYKVGFVGMTHLGLISSIVAASKKNSLICYHHELEVVKMLNNGKYLLNEPNFDNYFIKYRKNITYTNDLNKLNECQLIFFSYDTPIDLNGNSSYVFLANKIKKLIKILNKKIEIIILSQVFPGFTEKINWPKNKLFYQVETLVFGNAIERSRRPERLIIGSYKKDHFEKFNLSQCLLISNLFYFKKIFKFFCY